MPTPIKTSKLDATVTSASILNAVRSDLGGTYASVVPMIDTRQSKAAILSQLRQVGEILMTYEAQRNDFLNALVNRIAMVLVTSKLYQNPWTAFKKGLLEYGETVEEIFVNLAKSHPFDPATAESEVFKREIPDVRSYFHTMNYQQFYKVTISNDQLRQAFLSDTGITDLITRIIESLYTSASYDEFLTMKYMIAKMALDGNINTQNVGTVNAENADAVLTGIKELSNNLTFMNDGYNLAGVATYTNRNDQYLIQSSNFNAVIDVNALAKAFNLEYSEFLGHNVLVNNFSFTQGELDRLNQLFGANPNYEEFQPADLTMLENITGFLVDKNFFMIFDNFYTMTNNYNGQGLYMNYFYHVWKTFSASPFANAVLLTDTANSITAVAVTPSSNSVAKGASSQYTANVTATGIINKNVVWSIQEQNSTSTISPQGLLSVDADEPNTTLHVIATSVADSTKTGSAAVTVTG